MKLDTILRMVSQAEGWRDANYKELWERYYKVWRNHVKRTKSGRSQISVPYATTQVETIVPRIRETLFASRPYTTILGRESADEEQAKSNQLLLDWQQNERLDFPYIFEDLARGACIYGTCVAHTGWKLEYGKKKLKPTAMVVDDAGALVLGPGQEPTTQMVEVEEPYVQYDDPDVKVLDIMSFFIDSRAASIEEARFCGHLEYKTEAELRKMEKLPAHAYKIDWERLKDEEQDDAGKDAKRGIIGQNTDDMDVPQDKKLYEVMHYWENTKHVVVVNRKQLVMEEKNPFWHMKKPYDAAHYIRVPGEFYGIGVIELTDDLQQTLNTERNLRIDYRKAGLARMWSVLKESGIKPSDLLWRPDGVVMVNDHNDIREIIVQQMPVGSVDEEMLAKQDMRDATGAHDVVMGNNNPRETATATMTKDNNAAMRFRLVITNFERDLLVAISKKMLAMNQQFLTEARTLRVTNNKTEYVTVKPEDIQGEFDMIAAGSSVEPIANREVHKSNLMNLYNVVMANPLIQAFPAKQMTLLKKLVEAFDIKDVDSILPTEEELQQMQQQQAAKAEAEQAKEAGMVEEQKQQAAIKTAMEMEKMQLTASKNV